MAPRKMLTKPVEKALRTDMTEALAQNRFALNPDQTIDDVIEYIRAGIKSGMYQPGLTFNDFFASLTGEQQPADTASSGDDAFPQGAVETAKAEVEEPIDDLAGWLELYRKAKAKIDEAKEIAERAKGRITERLGDKTTATVDGKPVATWTWVQQNKFDSTKFKVEHTDLYEQYTKASTHRRFDLK